MISIFEITNTIFSSQTYVIYKKGCETAWIVDIGDVNPLLSFLEKLHLNVEGVFLTHAHFDHIYGLEALVEKFPECKVYVCEYAKQALASEKLNMSKYHGTPINYSRDNMVVVKEGESMKLFNEEPEILFAKKVLKKTMKDGWKVIMAIFALMLLMFAYNSFFGANDYQQNGKDSQEMKSDHSGERWISLPSFF